MPDSEAYHALDLHDGSDTLLEGMSYLSPKEYFFITNAEASNTLTLYTFKEQKIITVFTKQYPFSLSKLVLISTQRSIRYLLRLF